MKICFIGNSGHATQAYNEIHDIVHCCGFAPGSDGEAVSSFWQERMPVFDSWQTMLDQLKSAGKDVIAVGKIKDIFVGKGITESIYTSGNADGIEKTLQYLDRDFEGLCFVNLVDYDSLYGHRNDIDGYAKALTYFDETLPLILKKLRSDDILMITADHGCDPGYTKTTDHTREYTPFLMYGEKITPKNLGTRKTFADIGATVLQYFSIVPQFEAEGMLP